ncbi:MAG TPA: trypsin-like peptidase domain-containing protein [Gaiellaceae bacterium]|nr:trypsin-like peptidase domain-containing protein [Gaiellaceae bacterium]
MPSNRIAAAVAAAALVGGGAGAGIVALAHGSGDSQTAAPPTLTQPATTNVANTSSYTIGQIARQYSKSVVEIDAAQQSQVSPFGGSGGASAEGTGFVYDTKGDIVTNAHVVDGATSIKVKLDDGSTATATLVGEDMSTDVAVIHVNVDASKLQPIPFGDSSKAQVGDPVVAIGNPFGLDDTVTSGIVSALNRQITAPDNQTPIEGAIQTDAAINHGNSGGPLLNMQGQVIGITSQIQSDGGGNEGVGFAIPSNMVKTIADQLISTGKAQHALLGVTPAAATGGVKIASVENGSGADNAGLKVGDVITGVDGTAVTQPEQLRAIIAQHKPGDTITLTVRRGSDTKTVKATLGNRS